MDISDGVWRKGDDVFAQRFEFSDVSFALKSGLNVQEGQCAILLSGGSVVDVLPPGHLSPADMESLKYFKEEGAQRSFVMVDLAEIPFPVVVDGLRTQDDLEVDLHLVVVIKFCPDNAVEFMGNVLSGKTYLSSSELVNHIDYKDIVHFILSDVDASARDFCNTHSLEELFKDPRLRIELEDSIQNNLTRNLDACGLEFIRLKEVEFESRVFEELRSKSSELELKRKEIEFMMRADELANDATRQEAMSESEMEEFMDDLAHEKSINEDLRKQEIIHLKNVWATENKKDELESRRTLAEIEQDDQEHFETKDVLHDAKLKAIAQDAEIARQNKAHQALIDQKLSEQRSSLEYEQIEVAIQEMRVNAEQKATSGWVDIQQKKALNQQEIEARKIQTYKNADTQSIVAAIDDPIKAERVLKLREMELQKEQMELQTHMTPELLLAAAAARGIPEAAEALSKMSKEQLNVVEKAKAENTKIFEEMLKMNERMFLNVTDAMSKPAPVVPPSNTTQIIK